MSNDPHSDWPLVVPELPPAPDFSGKSHVNWRAIWAAPQIDPTAWVAPGAVVVGRVRLGPGSSVWYGSVLRGDEEYIEVGAETNIQDGAILHIDFGYPCILGPRVTLGHRAIVHASVVEEGALIGIAATVLSRCTIGAGALIAAGALVKEGTTVPPRTLWAGVPARQISELTSEQSARIEHTWRFYADNAKAFRARFGSTPSL